MLLEDCVESVLIELGGVADAGTNEKAALLAVHLAVSGETSEYSTEGDLGFRVEVALYEKWLLWNQICWSFGDQQRLVEFYFQVFKDLAVEKIRKLLFLYHHFNLLPVYDKSLTQQLPQTQQCYIGVSPQL